MTSTAVDAGKIDIARVIQQTFGVLGRNLATFAILTLVLYGVPAAIVSYFQLQTLQSGSLFGMSTLFGSLASLVFSAILQGTIVYATIQDLNDRRASVGDSLATGLRSFLQIVVVSILFAIAFVLACLLLIVPGIMLACAWCVVIPAVVADRTGIMGAFGRSAELTRGNRWRIFALLLIWVIVAWIASMIVNAVGGAPTFASATDISSLQVSPIYMALTVLVGIVTSLIGATGVAVLYVELRTAREGIGPRGLAEIFA